MFKLVKCVLCGIEVHENCYCINTKHTNKEVINIDVDSDVDCMENMDVEVGCIHCIQCNAMAATLDDVDDDVHGSNVHFFAFHSF